MAEPLKQFSSFQKEQKLESGTRIKEFYFSVLIFLVGEYFFELKAEKQPSGLIFPLAFVLFWAFYYSFASNEVSLFSIKGLYKLIFQKKKKAPVFISQRKLQGFSEKRARPQVVSRIPQKNQNELPLEFQEALIILCLDPIHCRDWNSIHKSFRELAKKYHPDLNSEKTQKGLHFIRIETAYRKLTLVQKQYFH